MPRKNVENGALIQTDVLVGYSPDLNILSTFPEVSDCNMSLLIPNILICLGPYCLVVGIFIREHCALLSGNHAKAELLQRLMELSALGTAFRWPYREATGKDREQIIFISEKWGCIAMVSGPF